MGGSRTRRKSPIADARVLLKVDILRYVIDIYRLMILKEIERIECKSSDARFHTEQIYRPLQLATA